MEEPFDLCISYIRNNRLADLESYLDSSECCLSINRVDQKGNCLLHIAAQNGSKRACKLLLRRGASLNYINNNGNTPIHYCFAYGYSELGQYLISKGADDSIRNRDGLTCFEGIAISSLNDL